MSEESQEEKDPNEMFSTTPLGSSKISAKQRIMQMADSTMLHMIPTINDKFLEDAHIDVEDEDDSLFHADGEFIIVMYSFAVL